MEPTRVAVVVVGAGQAGLGAAYYLAQAGVDFVVLERGRVGETWRSQRWDNFCLNTPNWINGLPGAPYKGDDPFGFMTHLELAESFEEYRDRFDLPVRSGVNVTRVRAADHDYRFEVAGETVDGEAVVYETDAVVIASGILQSPRIPEISAKFPESVLQLHAGQYRSPDSIPGGSVLVVGGGQSGAQIVEDLLGAGRDVYFSVSKVARLPRRYRGRDFMDWWLEMGIWDLDVDDVEDPSILRATNPLVSGVGPLGHTISFQQLARDGAHLVGRLVDVVEGELVTDDRLPEYMLNADERSQQAKNDIDAFIQANGLDAPLPEPDRADTPLTLNTTIDSSTRLNLAETDVKTIIWSTGFQADFSWIELPITDPSGYPIHHKGVSPIPGIHFIGFPWLSKRKSGIILGIDEDAEHISKSILDQLATT